MRLRTLAIGFLLAAAACGGSGSTQTPSTPTSPTPARWSLSGTIVEAGAQASPANGRVDVLDGANQGKTAQADAQGRYRFDGLEQGVFSIRASADGMDPEVRPVTLTSNQTVDFALKRTPAAGPGVSGVAIDGLTDRPLGGVAIRMDGLGETVTGADGAFHFNSADPQQIRAVTLSSSSIVQRATHLRVPGPSATLPLFPASLDLSAFDQMFRSSGVLHRWTTAPRVVVQTRVLKFTSISDVDYTAVGSVMTEAEVNSLLADLRWALPQLTGDTFTAFADEQRETAAEGERVRVSRPGWIVVARYEGLTTAINYWGYTRWSWNGAGEMQAGIMMIDRAWDASGSVYCRSLRAHEFGHALGYTHVFVRQSVMNTNATTEPNAFDRDGARLAFLRPPLNRTPDIDPDPFTGNLRALARQIFWAGDR
ncbi:MAG: hypothetical protein A3H96_25585 [Acidobacteria bacterium RIFCSPLOWO2_02_FULL_67_36]|nr:MAG: hypothetical protein A3H96_25585 [Acidobacteria bacterium RIFCSPLOWO2_02_FULL_67_36]